jgi:hypothetical protein
LKILGCVSGSLQKKILALKWTGKTFISGEGFEPTVLRFGLLEAAQALNSVANIVCCKGGCCAQIWDDKTDVVCIRGMLRT